MIYKTVCNSKLVDKLMRSVNKTDLGRYFKKSFFECPQRNYSAI